MADQQAPQDIKRSEFSTHFPAAELPVKNYSLEADMINGWRPKSKVVGPIPFNFDSQVLDELIDELTSFGSRHKERVVYLGNRCASSFKLHEQISHEYRFKHEALVSGSFSHMAAYFKKFHSHFKSKRPAGRLFKGMNPTIKPGDELVFDSNFESGNLDAAIKVGENEYDLFMRIDTNTRGHLQWFNFTVRNVGRKKVRFNIVNFKKYKSLYSRGMKPYIYSEHLRQTKELNWHQAGTNLKYQREKLRYEFLGEIFLEENITFNCLKFDYVFETDWETIQVAYCPPFTYSQLLREIAELKKEASDSIQKLQQNYIKSEYLGESLGGLDIPLLTVTDPQVEDRHKKCVLISGRIHPGETCGSHMMSGFLRFICGNTEEAKQLRKQVIFKVVPMLNPDGVVVGNFRTSLCGRDLNRQFRNSAEFLIPEVRALKQLVIDLKAEHKGRFIFFLDFHGHSVKKNVFLYGPEYEIWENNYYKTRIFPKLLASKTEMFRYYSCLFRIADFKRTTARAVVLNNVPHCYTIEASTGFYYSPEDKKDAAFTIESWQSMGAMIAQCIKEYLDLMYDQEMTKEVRKQKLNELRSNRVRSRPRPEKAGSRNQKFHTRLISVSSSQKHKESNPDKNQERGLQGLSQRARMIIESIKQYESAKETEPKDQGHESDGFSEGGSDSEGEDDDIPEQELNNLHQQILSSIKQFRCNFLNQKGERQYSFKEARKKQTMQKRNRQSVKLKPAHESKGIEMIASLRKKAEHLEKNQQIFKWPKMRQETQSFTSGITREVIPASLSQQKTKMNFKTYFEQIQNRKALKTNPSGLLEILGEGKQFKDTNLIKN